MTKRKGPNASGGGKEAGEEEDSEAIRALADEYMRRIASFAPAEREAFKHAVGDAGARFLDGLPSSPATALAGHVLHGEILPPKPKRSRAVATPRPSSGKGISTDLQAKSAGPGVHKIANATGLNLKVGDNGSGSYVWRYRFAGKRREIGLGSRKDIDLAKARILANEQKFLRGRNIDPIDERRREREKIAAEARAAKPVTFREMTEQFLDENAPHWKRPNARTAWLSPVLRYAYPKIGEMGVHAISVVDVRTVIAATKAAGFRKVGGKVRSQIEQVLNFAISLNHRSADKLNPASGKLHPKSKKKIKPAHFRAVELEDAPGIFRELRARIETHTAFACWCFMVLTASRPSEAIGARWEQIDDDKLLWTKPPGMMKAGVPHVVPLSPAALEILEHQRSVRTGDSVFPGRGGSPISYANFFTVTAKAGIDAATPHGWRSVFKDYCGDVAEDVSWELAEAALAHSLSSLEEAYRHRTAVEKRRKVMIDYANWLNSVGPRSRHRLPPQEGLTYPLNHLEI